MNTYVYHISVYVYVNVDLIVSQKELRYLHVSVILKYVFKHIS